MLPHCFKIVLTGDKLLDIHDVNFAGVRCDDQEVVIWREPHFFEMRGEPATVADADKDDFME